MDELVYEELNVAGKRKETPQDHQILAKLFSDNWLKIRDFPKKSYDEINHWQLERIKQLVRHAYETVPLYFEKYSNVGFEPGDIKSWDDFSQLPLIYKEDLIHGFPEKTVSSKYNLEFTTRSSGSSGTFVTVAVSPEAIYTDTIQGVRQFYFQSGYRYSQDDTVLFIAEIPWWFESINERYPTITYPLNSSIEGAVEYIQKIKPKVISLYPSLLEKLLSVYSDFKSDGTELIVVHSEQSNPNERKRLSKDLGVMVLDEFSSEELTRIALECPSRKYHLEEDACYIEILDIVTHQSLSNENKGVVVGTNLINNATPLIRYFQGDIATMLGNITCSCNSNFRVLESLEGRYMDSLILPEGEMIASGNVMGQAYYWFIKHNIPVHGLRYQVVQNKLDDITLYIIPGSFNLNEQHISDMVSCMQEILPTKIRLKCEIVDSPPYNQGRKYKTVVSLVKRQTSK